VRTADKFLCDIRFPGCEDNAIRAWLCQVEQIEVAACAPCSAAWQALTREDPDLALRCPSCSKARMNRPQAKVPVAGPITGLVADALDEAMRVEGILIQTRQAVLRRIARDAPWLNAWGQTAEESAPLSDPGGQPGDQTVYESAALSGRAGGVVGAPVPAQAAVY
jgi:hypothetical protein